MMKTTDVSAIRSVTVLPGLDLFHAVTNQFPVVTNALTNSKIVWKTPLILCLRSLSGIITSDNIVHSRPSRTNALPCRWADTRISAFIA
jgi:hypothetical protein